MEEIVELIPAGVGLYLVAGAVLAGAFLAEPVRARGQLERRGSLEVLRVDGAGIERLSR